MGHSSWGHERVGHDLLTKQTQLISGPEVVAVCVKLTKM